MTEPMGLREAAIAWLQMRTDCGQEPLTRDDILDFTFQGETFRLQAPQQGIWKPRGFQAALSITTKFSRPGEKPPYEDDFSSEGVPTYMWRGDDPFHHENVALRNAMDLKMPIIWYYGVGLNPARYLSFAPMLVIDEDYAAKRFYLTPVDDMEAVQAIESSPIEGALRRYIVRQSKARVHQPVFRSTVLTAYENRCAVCSLAHPRLLDAAHIVDDKNPNGIASVVNGLAMCKIHHAAFDGYFLGVRPDQVIQIRHDLLDEIDGPMLKHGLQELHGKKLMTVPKHARDRPSRTHLEEKYELFKTATLDDMVSTI